MRQSCHTLDIVWVCTLAVFHRLIHKRSCCNQGCLRANLACQYSQFPRVQTHRWLQLSVALIHLNSQLICDIGKTGVRVLQNFPGHARIAYQTALNMIPTTSFGNRSGLQPTLNAFCLIGEGSKPKPGQRAEIREPNRGAQDKCANRRPCHTLNGCIDGRPDNCILLPKEKRLE